jgi:hypothetical protein
MRNRNSIALGSPLAALLASEVSITPTEPVGAVGNCQRHNPLAPYGTPGTRSVAVLSVFVMHVPGLDPGIDPCIQGRCPRKIAESAAWMPGSVPGSSPASFVTPIPGLDPGIDLCIPVCPGDKQGGAAWMPGWRLARSPGQARGGHDERCGRRLSRCLRPLGDMIGILFPKKLNLW